MPAPVALPAPTALPGHEAGEPARAGKASTTAPGSTRPTGHIVDTTVFWFSINRPFVIGVPLRPPGRSAAVLAGVALCVTLRRRPCCVPASHPHRSGAS